MKIQYEVEIEPFSVPNFVLVISKEPESRSQAKQNISLKELDAMTLDRLCNDFRDDVFKRAEKQQPARLSGS